MEGLRPGWTVKAILLIIISSIFFRCVWATNHSVGGETGWDLGADLQTWSTATTFRAGDFLVFKYLPVHDVLEVNQIDYFTCRTIDPIRTYNDGETVIHLNESGNRYFLCGRFQHCFMGLKLQVQVLDQLSDNSTDGGDVDQQGGTPSAAPSVHPQPPPPPRSPPSPNGQELPAPDESSLGRFPPPCRCSGVSKVVVAVGLVNCWWIPLVTLLILSTGSQEKLPFHD